MPNANTVLVINPNFDVPTSFIHLWANEVIIEAQQLGLNVINLDTEEARLPQFESSIANDDPILFFGNGHGAQKVFTGDQQNHILWIPTSEYGHNDSNINLVQGRITYLLSCLTGTSLGPAIAAQENTGYLGYVEDFIFNGFEPGDEYSRGFGECSNAIMRVLLNGGTIQEAYDEGIRMFNLWIDIWEQSSDEGASFIISSLIHDRDALIALPGMPIPPPASIVERKSIFPEMTIAGYGMMISAALL